MLHKRFSDDEGLGELFRRLDFVGENFAFDSENN
jgi:hypothetical protein